jgi:GH25 family lysozyme M1 (1,4-beta-N-acetylmuramidase)
MNARGSLGGVFQVRGWEEGIDYETSVEETLCFRWIDSIIQKIDEEKYSRKFNPRRLNGKWSETNKPWKRWCRSFLKAAKWFYWVMPSTIPPK